MFNNPPQSDGVPAFTRIDKSMNPPKVNIVHYLEVDPYQWDTVTYAGQKLRSHTKSESCLRFWFFWGDSKVNKN